MLDSTMPEKPKSPPPWHSPEKLWRRLKGKAKLLRREQTTAEAELWGRLRGGKLGGFRFRRQHAIGQFVVDFFCWKANLVIELDGEIHATKRIEDRARQDFLEGRGLRVLRFSNARVFADPAGVIREISAALVAPDPTSPPSPLQLERGGEGTEPG